MADDGPKPATPCAGDEDDTDQKQGEQQDGRENEVAHPTSQVASADFAGWLRKRGQFNKDLKKRLFLVNGQTVSYYDTEEAAVRGGKAKGQAMVSEIGHVSQADAPEIKDAGMLGRAFRFVEERGASKKQIVVVADDTATKHAWLRKLRDAIGIVPPPMTKVRDWSRAQQTRSSLGDDALAEGYEHAKAGRAQSARAAFEQAAAVAEDAPDAVTKPWRLCALYELGLLLGELGQGGEAAAALQGALAISPAETKQHVQLQLAWQLWKSGKSDEADRLYADVLDADVFCWQAMLDRARMHLAAGEWAEALADLNQACALGQDGADVHNDCGVCHYEMGDAVSACEAFDTALQRDPAFSAAVTNRASCLRNQGKLREAESDYCRAIELEEGKNPKTFMNRGLLLEQLGDVQGALADFSRVRRPGALTSRYPHPPHPSPPHPHPILLRLLSPPPVATCRLAGAGNGPDARAGVRQAPRPRARPEQLRCALGLVAQARDDQRGVQAPLLHPARRVPFVLRERGRREGVSLRATGQRLHEGQ